MKHRRGDQREDGLFFLINDHGREVWGTAEQLEELREKSRVKARLWWERNKHREDVKERNRRTTREYAMKNPEKYREAIKQWEKNNPEAVKKIKRKWVEKNPEKVRQIRVASEATRRARKKSAGCMSTQELRDIKAKAKGRCFYCGRRRKLTFDHVVPIAAGGTHAPDNLVMACKSCNSRKGTLPPEVFAQRYGRLLV